MHLLKIPQGRSMFCTLYPRAIANLPACQLTNLADQLAYLFNRKRNELLSFHLRTEHDQVPTSFLTGSRAEVDGSNFEDAM